MTQELRLEDRFAINEQMFHYARATDWLDTENHRDVFVTDCVFASPHSGDTHGVDAVVAWRIAERRVLEAGIEPRREGGVVNPRRAKG
jgi:SnoaL-like domain